MSRSVVTKGTERCTRCQFAFRWCICEGVRTVEVPFLVDVMIHRHEAWRPTSTGRLLNRVVPASRGHVYSHDIPLVRETIVRLGHALWILHPLGELAPCKLPAEPLQVLLLDGSWREASRMRKAVEGWGRMIRLPPGTGSRYRLRSQHAGDSYSTIEALMLLLEGLGLPETAARLRVQFELHVYAGLRTRGAIREAAEFLADSPLASALPDVIQELQRRRRVPPAQPDPARTVGTPEGS